MLTKIYSASIDGIDANPVIIETVVERGAQFTIVGLPDAAVRESYQRMISAISHSGVDLPRRRTIINLAPADVKKEGSGFDLPMAIGLMASSDVLKCTLLLTDYMLIGELSLDGTLMPIRGALPIAIRARQMGIKRLIVPADNVTEAAVVNNLEVYGAATLSEVIAIMQDSAEAIKPTVINTREIFMQSAYSYDMDFSEVRGQESVKRAFEVACAGGHNILLVGTPGSGKSMLAKRLPTIMPPLSMAEALETTKIHSIAGTLPKGSMLMTRRPFRTPHHTVSPVALVGGGTNPHPGEISLAHNGILYLDEFPEFPRTVLEVLRQPLEDRQITISRAKYSVKYPASFMLVASMNPCPCGYYNHPDRQCTCMPGAVSKYVNRISGPLLDRIDLQVEIMPVAFDKMADTTPGESSASIRERIIAARAIQQERYSQEPGVHCNAQMNSRLIRKYAWPDAKGLERLKERMTKLSMSARAFDRILRVARTIADLENCAHVQSRHIAEAIGYRSLDRGTWGTTF